jgi:hypothetical protein
VKAFHLLSLLCAEKAVLVAIVGVDLIEKTGDGAEGEYKVGDGFGEIHEYSKWNIRRVVK